MARTDIYGTCDRGIYVKNGKFLYDNQALKIDAYVDPRLKRPVAGNSPDKVVEASAGVESITTKSPTHIDASTVGDTQTPSILGEFDCITLIDCVKLYGPCVSINIPVK